MRQVMNMPFVKASIDPQGVVHVTLARPPANAVHSDMYREIWHLFENIDAIGDNVRAVVLGGEGRHFCAGNDLDEFATMNPDNAPERMWNVRKAFSSIAECRVPVIGAVQVPRWGPDCVSPPPVISLSLPPTRVSVCRR